MKDIKQYLKNYIIENFLFSDYEYDFNEDNSLMDSGILDSTGVLELITFIESNFKIVVEDDEVLPENFDSISGLQRYIAYKLK